MLRKMNDYLGQREINPSQNKNVRNYKKNNEKKLIAVKCNDFS